MKAVQVELPDGLASELEAFVKSGWFTSEAEVIRAASVEFVRRNRLDMLERFMREDIRSAPAQKGAGA